EEGYEEASAALFSYKTFSAVFSKDGSQVVTGDADQRVRTWDCNSGRLVKELDETIGFEWGVQKVAVSSDGRHLLTRSENGVQMWTTETGKEIKIFEQGNDEDEKKKPTSATFSPDGRFVLAGYSNNRVRRLDIK